MQQRLQQLLNDPIAGPQIMKLLNNPNTSVASQIGAIGNAVGKQTTTSGQIGAGVGTLAGMGLKKLLNKNQTTSPTIQSTAGADRGASGNTVDAGDGPYYEPNLQSPAGGSSSGDFEDFGDGEDYSDAMDFGDDFARGGKVPKRRFAAGGEAEAPPPKKRGVLVRRPILSTTIVIAPKKKSAAKKPAKKKSGGTIKASKPAALPPRRGPGNGGPPAPFAKGGHVQTPRGSGIAQRGKQFRGIY